MAELKYDIDKKMAEPIVKDLVAFLERIIDKCPSDSWLYFQVGAFSGQLLMNLKLNSATLTINESLEGATYWSMRRRLELLFKDHLEAWRRTIGATA
ncbi:MAG: hypothetical protein AB7F86_10275 [Bdellovibrionales bacterium]